MSHLDGHAEPDDGDAARAARIAEGPHAGIPDDDLTPLQQFDRMAWHRVEGMKIWARVRDYAAKLLAEIGVEGANDALPPDISVDSSGVVRFDDQWAQDEQWREVVAAVHDEIGDDILPRLPPDTKICAFTGVVIVDDSLEPWW